MKENFKLFGDRLLVEHVKVKLSTLHVPDTGGGDIHRLGRIIAIGDGTRPGRKPTDIFLKTGDIIFFQVNAMMQANCMYDRGDSILINLMQSEVIARVNSDEITKENFDVVGDWLLLKPFMREQSGSILIPDIHKKALAIYFELVKKGNTVDLDVNAGDELVVTHGRCNPLKISREDFGYIHKGEVHGVVYGGRPERN